VITQKIKLQDKLAITILVITIIGFFTFKMFEPIFVYNFGWEEFARTQTPPIISEQNNDKWDAQSTKSTEALNGFYKNIDTPAVSIAVAVDGELAWRGAIGFANLENQQAISFDDAFRLGSTSKAITSVAIATLVDQKDLKLDIKMGEIAPSLDESLHQITLAQAMSHRAGIRNYGLCFCFPIWEYYNQRQFGSIRESISIIENSDLLSEPGQKYSYTSLGFNLAGLAVEQTTGKSFSKALDKQVFGPLDMQHSYLEDNQLTGRSVAQGYDVVDGNYKSVFNVNNSNRWPSGGILSTPSDMIKLGNAMLDDRLLSNSVRDSILAIPNEGHENGGDIYALGWRISKWELNEQLNLKSYHHNGVAFGNQSIFVVFPEQRIVISAMMNKNSTNINELAKIVNQIAVMFIPIEIK